MKKIISFLKNSFFSGIIFWTPIAITFFIVYKIFLFLDQPTRLLIKDFVERTIPEYSNYIVPGIGLFITISIIIISGVFAKNMIGRYITNFFVDLMLNIPIINKIYKAVKEIVDSILSTNKKAYKRIVLIEYPRKGIWSIGFETGEVKDYLKEKINDNKEKKEKYIYVFLPTTPNPTSGYMLILKRDEVIDTDLTVEEALKLIMAGGAFDPREFIKD